MTSKQSNSLPKVLHCHSAFGDQGVSGQAALQSVRLMNAFGSRLSHSIVSAQRDQLEAAIAVNPSVPVSYPKEFPKLAGWSTPGRLLALAKAMQKFDLILTYGWGAMGAVMAHTVFGQSMGLAPLIHDESGFEPDEARKLNRGRNWYRRIALGRTAGLVVPSERLEAIALENWYQPIGRVKLISPGVDVKAYAKKCRPDALRRVVKHDGERWIGADAEHGSLEPLHRLITSLAELPEDWHAVIVGQLADAEKLRELASEFEVSHRVHLPGEVTDLAKVMGLFDIFAVPSIDAQMPVPMLQAMAAGLPVAAYDVGDIAECVAERNAPFIVNPAQPAELGSALTKLAALGEKRSVIGADNRAVATQKFDEKTMTESYRRLYANALDREI
ncbi:MAG: glycosyltransferase family 4 protein [Erythrobacter sp.]